MTEQPTPGEGPTRRLSVSLHESVIAALEERAARRGVPTSTFVEALVQRELERERLRDLIEDAEAELGPADAAAAEAKRRMLHFERAHRWEAVEAAGRRHRAEKEADDGPA